MDDSTLPIDAEALHAEVSALRREVEQLRSALESRVVVEQAKGVLAERLGLSIDEAFELLRARARASQQRIHDLAGAVLASRETPPELQ